MHSLRRLMVPLVVVVAGFTAACDFGLVDIGNLHVVFYGTVTEDGAPVPVATVALSYSSVSCTHSLPDYSTIFVTDSTGIYAIPHSRPTSETLRRELCATVRATRTVDGQVAAIQDTVRFRMSTDFPADTVHVNLVIP